MPYEVELRLVCANVNVVEEKEGRGGGKGREEKREGRREGKGGQGRRKEERKGREGVVPSFHHFPSLTSPPLLLLHFPSFSSFRSFFLLSKF